MRSCRLDDNGRFDPWISYRRIGVQHRHSHGIVVLCAIDERSVPQYIGSRIDGTGKRDVEGRKWRPLTCPRRRRRLLIDRVRLKLVPCRRVILNSLDLGSVGFPVEDQPLIELYNIQ